MNLSANLLLWPFGRKIIHCKPWAAVSGTCGGWTFLSTLQPEPSWHIANNRRYLGENTTQWYPNNANLY